MLNYRKSCFILAELCIAVVCGVDADYFDSSTIWSDKEYVDPHSFYYDKITNKESLPHIDSEDGENNEYAASNVLPCMDELNRCRAWKISSSTDIRDEELSRRLVNMLLNRASFKKEDSIFVGRIDLEASESELEILREFGAGKLSLREVDPILNSVLKAPDFNRVYETVVWMQSFTTVFTHHIYYHKEIVFGVLTVLYLYWQLRKVKWNFWKILSICIPLILIASFFITWWKLIEEARIKHVVLQVKHMQMPTQCQPDAMGWVDRIWANFYPDDCEKHYEAVMKNPELQVTPGQALTHMLANMSFEVFVVSGKAIATFLKDLTMNLPWYISVPIQIAVCIGIVPAVILLVILLLGGSVNLGFGPFSFFSLQGPRQSEASHASKIDRRTIENIPNLTFNVHIQDSGSGATRRERSHNLAVTMNSSAERSDHSNNSAVVGDTAPRGSNRSSDEHKEIKQDDSDKKKKRSLVKIIANSDLASGDSTSMNKSDSTENPVDTKVSDTVPESTKLQSGSGDN